MKKIVGKGKMTRKENQEKKRNKKSELIIRHIIKNC